MRRLRIEWELPAQLPSAGDPKYPWGQAHIAADTEVVRAAMQVEEELRRAVADRMNMLSAFGLTNPFEFLIRMKLAAVAVEHYPDPPVRPR